MTQPVRHEDKLTFDSAFAAAPTPVSETSTTESDRAQIALHGHPGFTELERLHVAVQDAVGEQNYQHWFHKRTRFEISGDRLIVRVPNPFILNWLLRRFRTTLNKAAQLVLGPSASSQLEVDESLMLEQLQAGVSAVSLDSLPSVAAATSQSLHSEAVNNRQASMSSATGVNARQVAAPPSEFDRPAALSLPANRRKFRSFDSFVSGECNDLAVLAARQVSAAPGERYNPLFIYGGTGTGKTHLLEAIYSEVRRRQPSKNVMYLTSEAFNELLYFCTELTHSPLVSPTISKRGRAVDRQHRIP